MARVAARTLDPFERITPRPSPREGAERRATPAAPARA